MVEFGYDLDTKTGEILNWYVSNSSTRDAEISMTGALNQALTITKQGTQTVMVPVGLKISTKTFEGADVGGIDNMSTNFRWPR